MKVNCEDCDKHCREVGQLRKHRFYGVGSRRCIYVLKLCKSCIARRRGFIK